LVSIQHMSLRLTSTENRYFQNSMFRIICFHFLAPSVTVRPQGSSPYKKADILASGAAVTAKGRSVVPGPSTAPTVVAPASSEDAARMQVRFRQLSTWNWYLDASVVVTHFVPSWSLVLYSYSKSSFNSFQ
jgi:hypothetical protein